MAEQRKQGDQTPVASVEKTADVAATQAPEPSSGARKKLAVAWPSNSFVVEGLPVLTREGTPVTAEQQKKYEEVAKKSGVTLREVND